MKKVVKPAICILTAYIDQGGDLNFHGGKTVKDLEKDLGKGDESEVRRVLRQFWIEGKIVKERGEDEPIKL
jgi:hypothetical protein